MSDLEKIKNLRQSTGAGFKDCSSALKESDGDIDKAIEILRVKGISKASKKMSRDAKEGVVAVSGNENKTSIIWPNAANTLVFVILTNTLDFSFERKAISGPYNPL